MNTRRRFFGLIAGSAAAIALADLRSARAHHDTGCGHCAEHEECDRGRCKPRRCSDDDDCPDDCSCGDGYCEPDPAPPTTCGEGYYAEQYQIAYASCVTPAGPSNCHTVKSAANRRRCHARRRRVKTRCQSVAASYAQQSYYNYCTTA